MAPAQTDHIRPTDNVSSLSRSNLLWSYGKCPLGRKSDAAVGAWKLLLQLQLRGHAATAVVAGARINYSFRRTHVLVILLCTLQLEDATAFGTAFILESYSHFVGGYKVYTR